VFGRQERNHLALQKQALLLQSAANRLELQAELQQPRSATAWMSRAAGAPRRFTPGLVLLGALGGFLVVRTFRRPDSWLSRLAALAKWIGPIYSLWRHFSAGTKRELSAP
jgi:hypothetical protein